MPPSEDDHSSPGTGNSHLLATLTYPDLTGEPPKHHSRGLTPSV